MEAIGPARTATAATAHDDDTCNAARVSAPGINARDFVASLLSAIPPSLHSSSEETDLPPANPLHNAPDAAKNVFLTLYVLFEKELLPALDLLDRGLVTRLRVHPAAAAAESHQPRARVPLATVYLIRSTQPYHQQQASHNNNNNHPRHPAAAATANLPTTHHHEVRLPAWSCSCPAFTFSAFPAAAPPAPHPPSSPPASPNQPLRAHASPRHSKLPARGSMKPHPAGGLTLGSGSGAGTGTGTDLPPVCKHLLACALAEHCAVFAACVAECKVAADEGAGWAAGWGD